MTDPIRAVLFDLDGTLVDNMSIHGEAWATVSAKYGHPVSAERISREWAGKKNEELIPLMLERDVTQSELRDIAHEKETRYRERAAQVLREVPGTSALLTRLRAAGLKLAVATAAPEENRALALDGLKLRHFFDAVVGPEGSVRGKPFPDIFLASARAVGVEAAACLVFEDALNGVRAALAAQMPVAGVTTMMDAQALLAAGASWAVQDFRVLPEGLERALFGG